MIELKKQNKSFRDDKKFRSGQINDCHIKKREIYWLNNIKRAGRPQKTTKMDDG